MKDKVIVITGGSRGLGKGMAQLLASKKNTVVICSKNKTEVEKTAKDINATAFVADVTKESDVKALADFTVKQFGGIDVWINNAGVWLPHATIEEVDMKRVDGIFAVNVFGTMYGAKTALLQMRKQQCGTVVNIVSTSGLDARPTSSIYAASKWAVRGFTDSIREEYRETNIKILAVYPGGMQTALFDEKKPNDINTYMSFESVAEKIVANLELAEPLEELIIKRPS
ncbi:MAG: SDR family oxidoreductase [Patescibacteria group bacterium]|jgi:short-subunit dehydrogenase